MAAEKEFEKKVKKFLTEEGCWFIKYWGGGGFTKSGIPDILCCCKGHFLGIELKASTGKPSELQLYHLNKIDEAGGLGILLYPEDFQTFKRIIRNLPKTNIVGDPHDIYLQKRKEGTKHASKEKGC